MLKKADRTWGNPQYNTMQHNATQCHATHRMQRNATYWNPIQCTAIQCNVWTGCTVGSLPIRQMMQTEQSRGGKQGPLSNAMQNTNTNQDTNTNEKHKYKFNNRRKTAWANQNFGRE